jgi:hypothetical protein
MAKIAAENVTVTLNPEDIDRSPDGRIGIRTFPTILFGNSTLEYTALGIPMPALGKFGFLSAIKRAYIEQPANGFIYHFDRANHKLRIFQGGGAGTIAVANHVNIAVPAPANHSHDLVIAANSAGATDAQIGANSANKLVANIATAYTIPGGVAANGGVANAAVPAPANIANLTHTVSGAATAAALAEVGSTHAPAPTTLYMEMVGR